MSESSLRPVIFGFAGVQLSDAEADFFHEARPWGVILFARNIETRAQVRALTDQLRAASGNPHLPILIDQEGGRVARLRPPLVAAHPPAAAYGTVYRQDPDAARHAAQLGGALLAADLHDLGINITCAPCLDLGLPGMSDVIGDRAFGDTPEMVGALGAAFADGLQQGGVLPVIKHMPGHGRATVDSHFELPVIEAPVPHLQAQDFEPFRHLNGALLGMTGHLLLTAIDEAAPVTLSPKIIDQVIRQHIGFDGVLMGDDVSMQALRQPLADSAAQSLAAGCDVVLHCNGDMAEMRAIAAALPDTMDDASAARIARVDAALANLTCDVPEAARQTWGEIMGDIFPAARNAL